MYMKHLTQHLAYSKHSIMMNDFLCTLSIWYLNFFFLIKLNNVNEKDLISRSLFVGTACTVLLS